MWKFYLFHNQNDDVQDYNIIVRLAPACLHKFQDCSCVNQKYSQYDN